MFDDILLEIQQIDPLSNPMAVKPADQQRFLVSWLRQAPQKSSRPQINALARKIAWKLANHNASKAFTLLYPQYVVEMNGEFTERHFLERKFIVEATPSALKISALKHWKKVVKVGNQAPISDLILLYEAALKEVRNAKVPAWIQIEALESLQASFDVPLIEATAFVKTRKNRLAALMLDPATIDLPAMQNYWQAYQTFYGVEHFTPAIHTEFTPEPEMKIPSVVTEMIEVSLPENPSVEALSDFRKHETHKLEYLKAVGDRTKIGNDKAFLAQRQFTQSALGYTADSYSPANTYCAKLAESLVDKTKPNPREQFWKLLYPHLEGVYLGYQDSDWPDYGEALLWGNLIVNYRKLALMAQHRDLHKVLTTHDESKIVDKILEKTLTAMPSYRKLSLDEQASLENFECDQAGATYWKSNVSNRWDNAFEFFTELLGVLDRYRATDNRNRNLESQMSLEGLQAMAPYTQYLFTSSLVEKLRAYQKTMPPTAADILKKLDYLINFRDRMMTRAHSCFNAAYGDIKDALSLLGENLRDNIELKESDFIHWDSNLNGKDTCAMAPIHSDVIGQCLQSIFDSQQLIEWIKCEAGYGTPLPIQNIADRFLELSGGLTATQIFNFVLTHLPNDGKLMFSDQIGHEDALAFTRNAFLQRLFPDGIEPMRLLDAKDFTCAMKLHGDFGVPHKEKTLQFAFAFLKNPENYKPISGGISYFSEIIQLVACLANDGMVINISQEVYGSLTSNEIKSFFNILEVDPFSIIAQKIVATWGTLNQSQMYSWISRYLILPFEDTDSNFSLKKQHILLHLMMEMLLKKNDAEFFKGWIYLIRDQLQWDISLFVAITLAKHEHMPGSPLITVFETVFGEVCSIFIRDNYMSSPLFLERLHSFLQEPLDPEMDSVDKKFNLFKKNFHSINDAKSIGTLLKTLPEPYHNEFLFGKFNLMSKITDREEFLLLLKTLTHHHNRMPLEIINNFLSDASALHAFKFMSIVGEELVRDLIRVGLRIPPLKDINSSVQVMLSENDGLDCMGKLKLLNMLIQCQSQSLVNEAEKWDQREDILNDACDFLLKDSKNPMGEKDYKSLVALSQTNPELAAIFLLKTIEHNPNFFTVNFIEQLLGRRSSEYVPYRMNFSALRKMLRPLVKKRPDLFFDGKPPHYSHYLSRLYSLSFSDTPEILETRKEFILTLLSAKRESVFSTLFDILKINLTLKEQYFLINTMDDNEVKKVKIYSVMLDHLLKNIHSFSRKVLLVKNCIDSELLFDDSFSPTNFPNNESNSEFSHLLFHAYREKLARFKAIYDLLVTESTGGRLFHSEGIAALEALSIDKPDGWHAFFASPAMNATSPTVSSLHREAWRLAIISNVDKRKTAVTESVRQQRLAHRFFFQYNPWQPSPALAMRIDEACALNPKLPVNLSFTPI